MRAPSFAIARFVRAREGIATSAEILERYGLSQSTLRRRRPELARLGIVFISDGNRSMYATRELVRELTDQVPTNCHQKHGSRDEPSPSQVPVTTS
jgi:DNA-binding IscR family transcriptional regulator